MPTKSYQKYVRNGRTDAFLGAGLGCDEDQTYSITASRMTLGRRFEVAKWRVFYHPRTLQISLVQLK